VVGITINEYQVQRATYHNEKQGLAGQCRAVRGNFLDMPFDDASFDAAYAMEATCHAPTLQQVRRRGGRGGAAAWRHSGAGRRASSGSMRRTLPLLPCGLARAGRQPKSLTPRPIPPFRRVPPGVQ
jgi:hypothetical protein